MCASLYACVCVHLLLQMLAKGLTALLKMSHGNNTVLKKKMFSVADYDVVQSEILASLFYGILSNMSKVSLIHYFGEKKPHKAFR